MTKLALHHLYLCKLSWLDPVPAAVVVTVQWFSAWFHGHRDPDLRGRLPGRGEEDHLPAHGTQQH